MDKRLAEKTLGLTGQYSMRDVNKAYRRLAMKYHPDKSEQSGIDAEIATKHMASINDAKDTLASIFDRTGQATISCNDTFYNESYDNSRYADAVRDARRQAAQREAYSRQTKANQSYHTSASSAASSAASAAKKAGKGAAKAGKKAFKIANILRKALSYDVVYRFLFLFSAIAFVCGAKTQLSYGFFSSMTVAGIINMFIPIITTPLRKLALRLIDKISPI